MERRRFDLRPTKMSRYSAIGDTTVAGPNMLSYSNITHRVVFEIFNNHRKVLYMGQTTTALSCTRPSVHSY